uniref:Neuroguidin n=1 Tax=Kalanchoe fedtschenkoi TaxID=63787 RepID=A0A7N0UUT0_KALFE
MEPPAVDSSARVERVSKQAPQLVSVLREMKGGLDVLRSKVEALTAKVKENQYPTADGISYLEAKHLLLLSYCQSLVYYLLRKAKGLPIEGHPVVRSLVEIRLFLEKVRGIDKKMQYQIRKLMGTAEDVKNTTTNEMEPNETEKSEDTLKYRPNPEMLISKSEEGMLDSAGVYRPPKFAPAIMDEDKMSREEKKSLRKQKLMLRQSENSMFFRDLRNELEGRPEEVREVIGNESRELTRYLEKRRYQERLEEENFTRAPVTKMDKKKEKHLKKSRNGLLGLVESPFDDLKSLHFGDEDGDMNEGGPRAVDGRKKYKKRKTKR